MTDVHILKREEDITFGCCFWQQFGLGQSWLHSFSMFSSTLVFWLCVLAVWLVRLYFLSLDLTQSKLIPCEMECAGIFSSHLTWLCWYSMQKLLRNRTAMKKGRNSDLPTNFPVVILCLSGVMSMRMMLGSAIHLSPLCSKPLSNCTLPSIATCRHDRKLLWATLPLHKMGNWGFCGFGRKIQLRTGSKTCWSKIKLVSVQIPPLSPDWRSFGTLFWCSRIWL